MKYARFIFTLVSGLVLAMPISAQVRDLRLSDAHQPGSVIVFPKFIPGTVPLAEGGTAPAAEIEYTIVCPPGQTCTTDQSFNVRFHWVCPGGTIFAQFVCKATDFEVRSSLNEKVVLVPDGSFPGVSTRTVPAASCAGATNPYGRGYLIGYIIDPNTGTPVKFDGLIGDGVLRESGVALASYHAIAIQADPNLATYPAIGSAITTKDGALAFDGSAGHYQAVTGKIRGDIRYTNTTGPTTFATGFLTLLTLNVRTNRPNNPVFLDLDLYGTVDRNPDFSLSTLTAFVCWTEQRLDVIDGNLTQGFFGREGTLVSGPATKLLYFPSDSYGPVTVLGLFENVEGPTAGSAWRAYDTEMFNDSVPVAASFIP